MADGSVASAVREARNELHSLRAKEEELRKANIKLKEEAAAVKRQEQALFARLLQARQSAGEIIMQAASASTSVQVLRALTTLVQSRREEDVLSRTNMERELESLRESSANACQMLQSQRTDSVRAFQRIALDWSRLQNEARQQHAELSQLIAERYSVEARNTTASLDHARELFELS